MLQWEMKSLYESDNNLETSAKGEKEIAKREVSLDMKITTGGQIRNTRVVGKG